MVQLFGLVQMVTKTMINVGDFYLTYFINYITVMIIQPHLEQQNFVEKFEIVVIIQGIKYSRGRQPLTLNPANKKQCHTYGSSHWLRKFSFQ